jgi:arylsulfatase A-like enzyme
VSSTPTTTESPPATGSPPRIGSILLLALWFGIAAGLVEGTGLLLFQRINWERWGPNLHVSAPIIWISPVVDLIWFSVLALALGALGLLVPKLRTMQAAIALLTALTTYDWLTVTGRLSHLSCLLLATGVGVALGRWVAKHEASTLQFVRRTLPLVLGTAVLAWAGIQGSRWLREAKAVAELPPADANAPNVLVIVVDTLRADHLSSFGYARNTSPNIDHAATQGVLFENAISPSSWTFPSHASLLTGRYQYEHGMDKIGQMPVLSSEAFSPNGLPTLGEALMKKGYRTGAFSANRTFFTRDLGFGRGFVHFEDYFHSPSDMFIRTLYGREFARLYLNRSDKSKVKRALRILGMDSLLDKDSEGSGNYGGAQGVRKRGEVVNQEVLRWIDRGGDHPFLAFLNYFDVHYPYGGPPTYPKPVWDHGSRMDQYDAGIKYADDAIGRLMQALDQRDLSKNTLVIITADHGESLGQHGLTYHGQALYWELIHVPIVIRYPGHVPAGVRVRTPVTSSALPATIMALLGGAGQKIFPGPPLNALWTTSTVAPDWPDALSEVSKNDIISDENKAVGKLIATAADGPMKSVVTARWHLIVHKELGDQLYDWVHDSGESNNLVNTAGGRQVSRELNSRLETLLARSSEKGRTTTAIALHNGRFDAREDKLRHEPARTIDDYYRVEAEPGSRLAVEIRAEPLPPATNRLDPVVEILDENGQPYQTCRNPGDDHIPAPGIADPTPDAFDDICVNDDIDPGVNTNARLEILVPGSGKSQVELQIRVSDWNGQAGVQMPYQLQLQEGVVPSEAAAKAVGQ